MARKHSLTELTAVNSAKSDDAQDEKLTAVNAGGGEDNQSRKGTQDAVKTARRAVGAVSQSFERLKMKGEIEIDPNLIDPAPIRDRLDVEGPNLDGLTKQIKEHGQQVAILVRPHPDKEGRYQLAYGRRRTAATKALGIKVRAISRNLSDTELVLAQGQENNERQDLSFIEKALYAVNLEEGGFDRPTIMAALSIDKTTCSRLISTVNRITPAVIEAIGSAPGIGRDRWVDLAARMKEQSVTKRVGELIIQDGFVSIDSDARFEYLMKHVTEKAKKPSKIKPDYWRDEGGQKITKIQKTHGTTVLSFDQRLAPEFGEFVLNSLPELYARYQKGREK